VLPASAGAKVGGEPTAATDAGANAAGKVGRWAHDGTPSGTLEEHYRTELPQPSLTNSVNDPPVLSACAPVAWWRGQL
jgi:hypothetical protein